MDAAWYKGWRRCRITGDIGVPSRPGLPDKHGGGNSVQRAHLYPVRLCSSTEARDSDNVICIRADLHDAMDGALLTYSPDGRVLVDRRMPQPWIKNFHGKRVADWTPGNRRYAARHAGWCLKHGFEPYQ